MADRILADPSRRRLFEKENLYNLLELPSKCKYSRSGADGDSRVGKGTKSNGETNSAMKNTDTSDSEGRDDPDRKASA